jgi:glycosyltransferase involved in cell wall biosynthesis
MKKKHNLSPEEYYMTRSDWIAYFLAKSGNNVIFEIHNYSKTRNYVLSKISKFKNVKLIFLTEGLKDSFSELPSKFEIIPSGVDETLFQEIGSKNLDTIFVGNLKRFGQGRNIDFLIKAFSENTKLTNVKLTIVGGPSEEVKRLQKLIKKDNGNIYFAGSLNRKETISYIQRAKVGILINSSTSIHSLKYTSPLKYFEYLYADLNIVAVDFESHHELPQSDNVYYYKENDVLDFSEKIRRALENEPKLIDKTKITMSMRVEQIINMFNT